MQRFEECGAQNVGARQQGDLGDFVVGEVLSQLFEGVLLRTDILNYFDLKNPRLC